MSALQAKWKSLSNLIAARAPIVTLVAVVSVLCAAFIAMRAGFPMQWAIRYLSIIPVLLVAYWYGLVAGLVAAVFFGSAFLPQLFWLLRWNGLTAVTVELAAFLLFLVLWAYIVADTRAESLRQEALVSAVQDWKDLLARTTDYEEVVQYILQEAAKTVRAERAGLILLSPVTDRWELVTVDSRQELPESSADDQLISLAAWLLEVNQPVVLNDMATDPRFVVPATTADRPLRCLLARPLTQRDGALIGMLVLINSPEGQYSRHSLAGLDDLVAGSERALVQAGLYTRTDLALSRRVKQLAAIERTIRQLNVTLDPRQIAHHTLKCALELAEGDAGAVCLGLAGEPCLMECEGFQHDPECMQHLLDFAKDLERAISISSQDAQPAWLAPVAGIRVLTPIRRETQVMGVILTDTTHRTRISESTLQAFSSLASHASIALENSRLFHEIQAEKHKAKLIVDSVADGLLTTDNNGLVVALNPAAERLTGWTSAEAHNQRVCHVLNCSHDDDDPEACVLLRAIRHQQVLYDDQWTIRPRQRAERVVSLSAAPLSVAGGPSEGLVIRFGDITEKREMEKLQRDLVAGFSHELRTPLAYISTVAEMMLAEEGEAINGRRREYLNILVAQSRRLSDFADKLLDASRLESGSWSLEPRPLPIDLLVRETVQQWQSAGPGRELTLTAPAEPIWVWADEAAVKTVLNSLVDNAVKYSTPHTPIGLRVAPDSEDYVLVAVQDQGPGIDQRSQEHIFERFYRVNGGDNQKVYGHGLGLWIARGLVEKMGGHLWVESQVGVGSTFLFTLPQLAKDTHE